MAPRWPQDGLKIAQDGPVVKPRALDVLRVMARSSIQTDTITRNAAVRDIAVYSHIAMYSQAKQWNCWYAEYARRYVTTLLCGYMLVLIYG